MNRFVKYQSTGVIEITTTRVFGLAFLLSLLVSISFFFFRGSPYSEVIVYFPDTQGHLGYPEVQFIPRSSSPDESLRLFVDEVLLGAIDILAVPIFDDSTRVTNLFFRPETDSVVISLTSRAMNKRVGVLTRVLQEEELAKAFASLEFNLRANFPYLNEITFLIDGQIPYISSYNREVD